MMFKSRPVCAHCVYWRGDEVSTHPSSGHCHRYPPGIYINAATGTVVQKFPLTEHSQWCGEWNDDEQGMVEAVRNSAQRHIRETASRGSTR